MERLQQFAAAIVAAVLAVLCMIVGILGLTVWKPAQEVVASVTPSQPFVITRDGVLPLFGQSVKVTASAAQDEEIALVVGTPADIMGWIGTSAYTEVIGVEGGLTSLKTTDHDSASTQAEQSGQAQSGQAQSGQAAQSGDAAQSAPAAPAADAAQSGQNIVTELVSNDMWSREVSGKGTVTLDLKDVGPGQAVLAATESGTAAPTLTLTWGVKKTNVLVAVASVMAAIFALVALALAYRQWLLLNSRQERAQRIAARESADITDTQAISLQEIADYAATTEGEQSTRSSGVAGNDTHAVPIHDEENVKAAATVPEEGSEDGARGDDLDGDGSELPSLSGDLGKEEAEQAESEQVEPSTAGASDQPSDEEVDGDNAEVHASGGDVAGDPQGQDATHGADEAAYFDKYADMVDSQVDASLADGDAEARVEDVAASAAGSFDDDAAKSSKSSAEGEARVLTIGRHAANGGPIEVDPPETVPTDTGTIDLSSIRPGAAVLPSRRALREARERGLERLVIDGREFDTGLLPVVNRDGEIVAADADDSASADAHASSDSKDAEGSHGGWTSLMSSWMKRNATSKEEE